MPFLVYTKNSKLQVVVRVLFKVVGDMLSVTNTAAI